MLNTRRGFLKVAGTSSLAGAALAVPLMTSCTNKPESQTAPGSPRRTKTFLAASDLATSDPNVDQMIRMYSKLEQVFGAGTSAQTPYPGQKSFLVLQNPGQLIDPSLDLTKIHAQWILSYVVNKLPYPNWLYQPSSLPIDSLYKHIIDHHRTGKKPLTQLEAKALDKAKKTLSSNKYDAYKQYRRTAGLAFAAWQKDVSDHDLYGTPLNPSLYYDWKDADNDWNNPSKGFKAEIETAQGVVLKFTRGNPDLYFQELSDKFNNRQKQDTSGEFYYTELSPTPKDWPSMGFGSYGFNQSDFTNQSESSYFSAGGGVSGGWGLWRFGGNYNYTQNSGWSHSEATNVSIEFEAAPVEIVRPWVDPLLFRLRSWIYDDSSPLLADGTAIETGNQPLERVTMPLYPTALLVARNVKMTANFTQNDKKWMDKIVDGGTSIGWGPFSLSGNFHQEEHSRFEKGEVVGSTLQQKAPQIIGWFCDVLPRSPFPDPNLDWSGQLKLQNFAPDSLAKKK